MSKKNKKKHHNHGNNNFNNASHPHPNSAPQPAAASSAYVERVQLAPQPVYRSDEHASQVTVKDEIENKISSQQRVEENSLNENQASVRENIPENENKIAVETFYESENSQKPDNFNKELQATEKKKGSAFGLFLAVTVIVSLLAFASVFISRDSWNQGLKSSVEKVFEENGLNYSIDHQLPLSNGLATSSAVFDLGHGEFAVIIRLTTIYGSLPGVYTYKLGDMEAKFLDYCLVDSLAKERIIENTKTNQISFWAKRIIKIVDTAVTEEAIRGGE